MKKQNLKGAMMTMARWSKRLLSSEESSALCRQNGFKWKDSGLCWVIEVVARLSHSQDLGQIGFIFPKIKKVSLEGEWNGVLGTGIN